MQKNLKIICNGLRLHHSQARIAKDAGVSRSKVSQVTAMGVERVLSIADLHSGSNVGLTPPAYQFPIIENPTTTDHRRRNKWARSQRECYDFYIKTLALLQPIDWLFVVGDLMDGSGHRSGGTEQITTDRKVQASMATEALEQVKPRKGTVLTFGTAYHGGEAEDFENDVAENLNAKIGSHEWVDIRGVIFDLKHHQGNTVNPFTSIYNNDLKGNREWASAGEQPKADVIIRAHTHRFGLARMADIVLISLPALQSYGSKFGARRCWRKVHFGMVALDVWPDGYVQEHVFIPGLSGHRIENTHRSE